MIAALFQHDIWQTAHHMKEIRQKVIPKIIIRKDGAIRRRYTFKQFT